MRLNIPVQEIESQGVLENTEFTMTASPAAFQMLSSGLYSNKIKAVIRELSCNAIDAHVSVGNPAAIQVKLPNRLDPQFYVNDTGPGLSHQDIMHMYTSYFRSSKQQSNDQIGGFGVGAKSPFAYTDAFMVESRHGGKCRIYAAAVSEKGVPVMSLMMERDLEANEPTGLKVSMPVKEKDMYRFESEAKELFKWYKAPVDILGVSPVERVTTTPWLPNAEMLPQSGYSHSMLRLGQVTYSMEAAKEALRSKRLHPELSTAMHLLSSYKILWDVPIGSVSVAASREELAFDTPTLDYLEKEIIVLSNEIKKKILQEYNELPEGDWNAMFKQQAFINKYNSGSGWRRSNGILSLDEIQEHLKRKDPLPMLEQILVDQGCDFKKFETLKLTSRIAKDPEITRAVDILQPTEKVKVGDWKNLYLYNIQSSEKYKVLDVLDVDIPPKHILLDKARLAWQKKRGLSSNNVAFAKKEGVSDQDYQHALEKIRNTLGPQAMVVRTLSSYLEPKDQQALAKKVSAAKAYTAFGKKETEIPEDDRRKIVYIPFDDAVSEPIFTEATQIAMEPTEPRNRNHTTRQLDRFIKTFRRSATQSRLFLESIGIHDVSRIYLVPQGELSKIQANPNAIDLTHYIVTQQQKIKDKATELNNKHGALVVWPVNVGYTISKTWESLTSIFKLANAKTDFHQSEKWQSFIQTPIMQQLAPLMATKPIVMDTDEKNVYSDWKDDDASRLMLTLAEKVVTPNLGVTTAVDAQHTTLQLVNEYPLLALGLNTRVYQWRDIEPLLDHFTTYIQATDAKKQHNTKPTTPSDNPTFEL
jgi:hypothetical protein